MEPAPHPRSKKEALETRLVVLSSHPLVAHMHRLEIVAKIDCNADRRVTGVMCGVNSTKDKAILSKNPRLQRWPKREDWEAPPPVENAKFVA